MAGRKKGPEKETRSAAKEAAKKATKRAITVQNPYAIAGIVVAALLVGIAVGYVLIGSGNQSLQGSKSAQLKAIILLDNKCHVCNSEVNRIVGYLDAQLAMSSIPHEYISVDDPKAKKILEELVASGKDRIPAIIFTGDVSGTEFYKKFDQITKQNGGAARFIEKVGDYYYLEPAWTTRAYGEKGEQVIAYVAPDVSKDAVEKMVYYILPSADLELKAADGDYMLRIEGPKTIIDQVKSAFPNATVEGNTITIPYVHVKISAAPSIIDAIVQNIRDKLGNAKIEKAELEANSPYMAVVETDQPDAIATILNGWKRDGNKFYVEKSERPKVELFVMSYCPFGVQTEKAILPVLKLLGDKVDFYLRFVNYAMHGDKEVWENLRQYCIQFKVDQNKFLDYLKCFTESEDANKCMEELNIDKKAVESCMDQESEKWGIEKLLKNKTGPFPSFPIDDTLNKKYGVRGSPTLVINGIVVPAYRNPESLKELICAAFLNPPTECKQKLSSKDEAPGFGTGNSSGGSAGQCG